MMNKHDKNLRNRSFIAQRFNKIQKDFLDLLNRDDEKSIILIKFQESFNKFLAEHGSYLEIKKTIEEINGKLDGVHDKLWEIFEKK